MSFNTLIRAYMDKAQATTEQSPVGRPSWLRKLAGSAAVGLGFGLLSVGCGSGDDPNAQDNLGTDDEGKEDKASSKTCYFDHDCKAGHYCKKSSAPVVTPKYGITPAPTYPTVKYGIFLPSGKCTTVKECLKDSDCATNQKCVGASAGSSCPSGAYCILPPTPATKGICTVECYATTDCPTGEVCVGASTGSSCPSGAYCILPPTPAKKGLCEMQITPKYGIQVPTK